MHEGRQQASLVIGVEAFMDATGTQLRRALVHRHTSAGRRFWEETAAALHTLPGDPARSLAALARGAAEGHDSVFDWVRSAAPEALPVATALAEALAPSFSVIAVDLPGFGHTPLSVRPDPSPAARAACVLALIAQLRLPPVILVGHSFGGAIALSASQQAPEALAGVVLLASAGTRRHRMSVPPATARAIRLLLRWPLTLALAPVLRSAFRARGFGSRWSVDSMVTASRGAASLDHAALASHARALACPALVAWALDDAVVQPSIGQALVEAVPDARALVLPDGGHDFFLRHPVPVAAAIADRWRGSVGATGRGGLGLS